MADDNRPLKYIRYAIGEIVLVVVGILIALQINNWNEDRKQHLNDIKFLKNLHYEIELDTTVLANKISNYKLINKQLQQALILFDNQFDITKKDVLIISMAIPGIEILTPAYKNIERNDIKLAEGSLDNINSYLNQKYLNYIENTKSNNDIISKLGESLQHIVLKDIYPKVDVNYYNKDADGIHFDIEQLKNDRSFKNGINRSMNYRNVSIGFMKAQKEKANELLIMLNEELKGSK